VKVKLDQIVFDAGTQIREALDQQVVSDYAEAMTNGAQFPPVVLFHDGNKHYLADGFHRFMAAQRIQARDIDAEVKAGSKDDALWFALGANKLHGKRLTRADKTHAVKLARECWPEKMQREVAEQVGCHPSLVSAVYAKYAITTHSEPVLTGRQRKTAATKSAIRELIERGASAQEIVARVGASGSTVAAVRSEMGLSTIDKTKSAIRGRRERLREMALEGYSSRQMAAELGLSVEGCRAILRAEGIDVPADRAVGKTKLHDSNRIVEQIVADTENLTEGTNLINYTDLDRERLGEWVDSLIASKRALDAFIKKLIKEKQKHGQAA